MKQLSLCTAVSKTDVIAMSVLVQMLATPCLAQSAPVSPDARVQELPQTLNAAPDEVLRPENRSDPVAALERTPRLVASEPRLASDELPSYSFGSATRGTTYRVRRSVAAPVANGADLAASPAEVDARVQSLNVTETIVASAFNAKPAGSSAQPERLTGADAFFQRPDVARITPLAIAFLLLLAGVLVAWRRSRVRLRSSLEAEDQSGWGREADAQWGSADNAGLYESEPSLASVPAGWGRKSRRHREASPTAPGRPGKLPPPRLIHALAGLNAELDDHPMPKQVSPDIKNTR